MSGCSRKHKTDPLPYQIGFLYDMEEDLFYVYPVYRADIIWEASVSMSSDCRKDNLDVASGTALQISA